MALSPKRQAQNFASKIKNRFGINLDDTETLELLFEVITEDIQNNLEAFGVESPSNGYFIEEPDGSGGTTQKPVQGSSTTGEIDKGNFR